MAMMCQRQLQSDGVVAFFDLADDGRYQDQIANLARRSQLVVVLVNREYFQSKIHGIEWQAVMPCQTPKLILSFDDGRCPPLNRTCTVHRCEESQAPRIVSQHIQHQQQLSIFISYARKDADHVAKLLDLISSSIAQVWIDKSGIQPGESFPEVILDAIESSNWLLLVWSRNGAASNWVKREWTHAMSTGKRIVPIRLDSTPLPPQLSNTQAFTSLDDEALFDFLRLAEGKRPVPVAAVAHQENGALSADGRWLPLRSFVKRIWSRTFGRR